MIHDIILKSSDKINNDLWDALKVTIREITMTLSKIKAKERRELTRNLEKTLEDKLADSDTAVIDKTILNNGIDGLTVELYWPFYKYIQYLIVFILNKCHEDRQLSFSQRTSVLTLLFKKR